MKLFVQLRYSLLFFFNARNIKAGVLACFQHYTGCPASYMLHQAEELIQINSEKHQSILQYVYVHVYMYVYMYVCVYYFMMVLLLLSVS